MQVTYGAVIIAIAGVAVGGGVFIALEIERTVYKTVKSTIKFLTIRSLAALERGFNFKDL